MRHAGACDKRMRLKRVPWCRAWLCRYHWVFANPVVQKLLPVYPGRRPLPPLGRLARAVTAPVRGLLWRTLKVVMLLHYRLPVRLWPRQSLEFEVMGSQGPSMCVPRKPPPVTCACHLFCTSYSRSQREMACSVLITETPPACPLAGTSNVCPHRSRPWICSGVDIGTGVSTVNFAV